MKRRKGLSIASMVLGIVGLSLSFLYIGLIPAVVGLILGIAAMKKHQQKGMAVAGIVCSIVGIMISAIMVSVLLITHRTPLDLLPHHTKKSENAITAEITETKLYDKHDVVITAKKFDENTLKMEIENHSDLNLRFQIHSYAANGIMIPDDQKIAEYDIPAGKKSNAKLIVNQGILKEYQIDEVKNISLLIEVSDTDTSKKIFDTGILKISTSLEDGQTEKSTGTVVLKEDGLLYRYISLENNTLTFSITNNTDHIYVLDLKDVSVNDYGFYTGQQFSDQYVYPGAEIIGTLRVDDAFLEDNEIDEITKIEFAILRKQDGDDSKQKKSGIITIQKK